MLKAEAEARQTDGSEPEGLSFSGVGASKRLTHYLFRYPSKFHPPFVQWALRQYSTEGSWVLDPMNGSGTVLVEAVVSGRSALGSDIDPLASFISRVKSTPISPDRLRQVSKTLDDLLEPSRRNQHFYNTHLFADISSDEFEHVSKAYWVPDIERVEHWFRRYVIVDLAKLLHSIQMLRTTASCRNFFLACFASTIRSVSNADPIPVSGLEVTKHMLDIESKGRRIDVFSSFDRRVQRALEDMSELWREIHPQKNHAIAKTWTCDIRHLTGRLNGERLAGRFDLVLTSPPYCNAVDYPRRHKLETYWLGLSRDRDDHLRRARAYVGTTLGPRKARRLSTGHVLADAYVKEVADEDEAKASALMRYFLGIETLIRAARAALKSGGTFILAVGDSTVAGVRIPTHDVIADIASPNFRVKQQLVYDIRNRYMHYTRRNGASINKDYVLVLE